MSDEYIDLTLQQMVQIALGTPTMTHVNIAVLQSLIEYLLRKINSSEEKVQISGFSLACLKELLAASKVSPLTVESIDKNSPLNTVGDQLNPLCERVKKLGDGVRNHLKDVERHKALQNLNVFDSFRLRDGKIIYVSDDIEDISKPCVSDNPIACDLLNNTDFLKKLMRRISLPVINRIFDFEKKISSIRKDLEKFIAVAKEDNKKIPLIEKALRLTWELNEMSKDFQRIFLTEMEEFQDLLDSKVNKFDIPAFKQYILEQFANMNCVLDKVQQFEDCPRPPGFIRENVKCTSCGFEKVGIEVGIHSVPLFPSAMASKLAKGAQSEFIPYDSPVEKFKKPKGKTSRLVIAESFDLSIASKESGDVLSNKKLKSMSYAVSDDCPECAAGKDS